MNNIIKINDIDIIFLSYDEPNAEYNYADLLTKAPWAKRVHGVKGSDAAHKACADLSDTEHFITVDGDNIVDPAFFNLELDLDKLGITTKTQLSWSGKNHINGLVYGNGGLKCWTREHVWSMKTHEAAEDDTNQVDFCWDENYHHMSGCYSVVYNNSTPLQAWRAGFREGVKMSLFNGVRNAGTPLREIKNKLPDQNYQRLLIWMSIGQEIKNGDWAVYGARLGCYMTNCTDWDYTQVRDFEYLNNLFQEKQSVALGEEIHRLGELIRDKLNMPVESYNEIQSVFFKATNYALPRSNRVLDKSERFLTVMKKVEYFDAVFISNGEGDSDKHYQRFLDQVPEGMTVHRVTNIPGIINAHKAAAELAQTKMFFVVDGDAWLVDTFKFPTVEEIIDCTCTYLYHSINPLNDLCYGYGGLKLFPKNLFDILPDSYIDMTTSLSRRLVIVPEISNITKFNTDAFGTWKSAFRECVKLSSRAITNQIEDETQKRLQIWLTEANGSHSEWSLKGAADGNEYGTTYKESPEKLSLINDFSFLKEMFDKKYV